MRYNKTSQTTNYIFKNLRRYDLKITMNKHKNDVLGQLIQSYALEGLLLIRYIIIPNSIVAITVIPPTKIQSENPLL